jgi:hypothetical protein
MPGVGLDYQYYKYITAELEERTIKVNTFYGAMAMLDLDPPDMTKKPFPVKLARKAYFQDANGRTRALVVGSPTAFAAINGASTVDLRDPGTATLVTFNFVGKHPEQPERQAHLIANQ